VRKSATENSKRGLKRHNKNVSRKKRTKQLRDFNNLVGYYKWVDMMKKQQQEQLPELLKRDEEITNG